VILLRGRTARSEPIFYEPWLTVGDRWQPRLGHAKGTAGENYQGAIKWGDAIFAFGQVRRLRGHPLCPSP
jgi:hypothetical protein